MAQKTILLIVTGSIAAYKSLDLIRKIRSGGVAVRCVLTKAAQQFVTPFAASALSENPVYDDLWSLKDESEMGHIRLSREADLVVVAPASADIIAKMAAGLADDLASATLLASNKPIVVAPAMNTQMWNNPATQRNIKQLQKDGVKIIAPASGELACGEVGVGKMAEVDVIAQEIISTLHTQTYILSNCTAVVTAGATFEPIDPVRFLGNHSSGKQGYAIAEELAAAGAKVTLISGRTSLPDPVGVQVVRVTTALEMLAATEKNLPADIAVCAAAVADFRPKVVAESKIKKSEKTAPPVIELVENPDILKTISSHAKRPQIVVGFAAETENLLENARGKLLQKKCDLIVANDVAGGKVFEDDANEVWLVSYNTQEKWEKMSKQAVAKNIVEKIAEWIKK